MIFFNQGMLLLGSNHLLKINTVNIYSPTNLSERKAFFDSLHEFFFPADFLVIGGDFNCYDHEMDKLGGNISIADCLTVFVLPLASLIVGVNCTLGLVS